MALPVSPIRPSAHMSPMTSVNTILDSVGIDRSALAIQVKLLRSNQESAPAPDGRYTVEALACALEHLAHRLSGIAESVESGFEDYYVGGTCMDVFAQALGNDDRNPAESVRAHLHLGEDALLTSSAVFGHPELRLVNHTELNHGQGTFTITSYLADIHTGDVTPVPGGPLVDAARPA